MDFAGTAELDAALTLLAATLEARRIAPVELVVIGGAALTLLGIRVRPTRDVDVLALNEDAGSGYCVLVKHVPLPEPITSAAAVVATALALDSNWLNPGPADLLDHDLPQGFEQRLTARVYGECLTVLLPSRLDLICLKVYAGADAGIGRHTEDLAAMSPTCLDLLVGARWARAHDPSRAFGEMLNGLLRYFDCDQAAEMLSDED